MTSDRTPAEVIAADRAARRMRSQPDALDFAAARNTLAALAAAGFRVTPEPDLAADRTPADVARLFHETYERLAPEFGYRTREASAVPWDEVPETNRALMIATVTEVLAGVPAVANTGQCPCGRPLDPTVFHDDDDQGRPLCVTCCPTCEHERHTQPCAQFAPAPGAAWAWCDHCGWRADHHPDTARSTT